MQPLLCTVMGRIGGLSSLAETRLRSMPNVMISNDVSQEIDVRTPNALRDCKLR
jgi:hypothetical protein